MRQVNIYYKSIESYINGNAENALFKIVHNIVMFSEIQNVLWLFSFVNPPFVYEKIPYQQVI